jgi:hypothetical protein
VKRLEHAIIAEKRTQELRVGSVDAVLSLAELIREEIITHDEALAILWPSGVWIDKTVDLLQRIVAGTSGDSAVPKPTTPAPAVSAPVAAPVAVQPGTQVAEGPTPHYEAGQHQYYLIPVGDIPEEAASETILKLVGKHSMWAFGQKTPNRTRVKPGDRVAFNQASVGVVATAEVATVPEDNAMPGIVKDPTKVMPGTPYPTLT